MIFGEIDIVKISGGSETDFWYVGKFLTTQNLLIFFPRKIRKILSLLYTSNEVLGVGFRLKLQDFFSLLNCLNIILMPEMNSMDNFTLEIFFWGWVDTPTGEKVVQSAGADLYLRHLSHGSGGSGGHQNLFLKSNWA